MSITIKKIKLKNYFIFLKKIKNSKGVVAGGSPTTSRG
jgi:hypothetical protein